MISLSGGEGRTTIISVVGDYRVYLPVQYRIKREGGGENLVCSRFSFLPIVKSEYERGKDVKLAVLIPHSLIQSISSEKPLLVADDRCMRRELLRDYERAIKEDLERNGRGMADKVEILPRVVQVRGSFSAPFPSGTGIQILTFDGDPSHTFVEVFRLLKRLGDPGDIFFDLSIGWNHLTVSALFGVMVYSMMKWGEESERRIHIFTSQPILGNTPVIKCGEQARGSSRPRYRSPPSLTSAALFQIDEIMKVYDLIRRLTVFKEAVFKTQTVSDIVDLYREKIHGELVDIFGEKGEEYARLLLRLLLQIRKVLCALESHIIPYVHFTLEELSYLIPKAEELREELARRIDSGEFIEPKDMRITELPGENLVHIEVDYGERGRSPLSYVLLEAVLDLWNDFGIDEGLFFPQGSSNLRNLGIFPPEMVDWLADYYRRNNMLAQLAVLRTEVFTVNNREISSFSQQYRNLSISDCKNKYGGAYQLAMRNLLVKLSYLVCSSQSQPGRKHGQGSSNPQGLSNPHGTDISTIKRDLRHAISHVGFMKELLFPLDLMSQESIPSCLSYPNYIVYCKKCLRELEEVAWNNRGSIGDARVLADLSVIGRELPGFIPLSLCDILQIH